MRHLEKEVTCLACAWRRRVLLLIPFLGLGKVLACDPLLTLKAVWQAAHDEVFAAGDELGVGWPVEVPLLAAKEDTTGLGRDDGAGADVPLPAANLGVEVELAGGDGAEVLSTAREQRPWR